MTPAAPTASGRRAPKQAFKFKKAFPLTRPAAKVIISARLPENLNRVLAAVRGANLSTGSEESIQQARTKLLDELAQIAARALDVPGGSNNGVGFVPSRGRAAPVEPRDQLSVEERECLTRVQPHVNDAFVHFVGLHGRLVDVVTQRFFGLLHQYIVGDPPSIACAEHAFCVAFDCYQVDVKPLPARDLPKRGRNEWFADGAASCSNGACYTLLDLTDRLGRRGVRELGEFWQTYQRYVQVQPARFGGMLFGATNNWADAFGLTSEELEAIRLVRSDVSRLPVKLAIETLLTAAEAWVDQRDYWALHEVEIDGSCYQVPSPTPIFIPYSLAGEKLARDGDSNWRERVRSAFEMMAGIGEVTRGASRAPLRAVAEGKQRRTLAGDFAERFCSKIWTAPIPPADGLFLWLGEAVTAALHEPFVVDSKPYWADAAIKQRKRQLHSGEHEYKDRMDFNAFERRERKKTHVMIPRSLTPAMIALELTPQQKALLLATLMERNEPRRDKNPEPDRLVPCHGDGPGYRWSTWCEKADYRGLPNAKTRHPELKALAIDLAVLHQKLGVEVRLATDTRLSTSEVIGYLREGARRAVATTQLLRIYIPKDFEERLEAAVERGDGTKTCQEVSVDGARVTMIRIATGLTKKALAGRLGVQPAMISQWERGVRPVAARHHGRLLKLEQSSKGSESNGQRQSGNVSRSSVSRY